MQETQETGVLSLGWEDPLEEETAPHSSILAWEIPWTEEPGGLQSMGSRRQTTEQLSTYKVRISSSFFLKSLTLIALQYYVSFCYTITCVPFIDQLYPIAWICYIRSVRQ